MLTLIRHGRPDFAPSPWRWRGRSDFRHFLSRYDSIPINPNWAPPGALMEHVNAAGAVFSSTAARARTSAELLLRERLPIFDPLFLEAPVVVPPLPGSLPLPVWTALGRLAWLGGVGAPSETPAQSQARANTAAGVLAEAARQHGSAVLIGHGWFNRLIGTALLKHGWRGQPVSGHGYWSHRSFQTP